MKRFLLIAVLIASLAIPMTTLAGFDMKISEDVNMNLGFRVQTQFLATNDNAGGTGESEEKFLVRRARFRLGGNVGPYVKFFLQTEFGGGTLVGGEFTGGLGHDVRMIDAMVDLHYKNYIHVFMGEWMAPAGRQHTTSSGALMAIDRPNITNYNLTWLMNGRVGFNTANFAQGNQALIGAESVRDLGATLFNSTTFSDTFHGKFYLGVYNGIDNTSKDHMRFTARAQLNFFDPEPGYFNLSTYLGRKKTVGIGASYDAQQDIDTDDTGESVDYKWFEADGFVDYPVGPGYLTAELGYQNLDLDNAGTLTTGGKPAKETQGDGFYGQIGYYLTDYKVQPWYGFDYWKSDASDDIGSFTSHRFGATYFFLWHNANVKAGYEYFKAKEEVPGQNDKIHTFIIGFYVTY